MNPLKHLARAFSKSLLITGMAGLVFLGAGCGEKEQKPKSKGPKKSAGAAFPGYNLVQQLGSRTTDLVDLDGKVVHQWKGTTVLGGGAELLPNGDLVRSGSSQGNTTFGRLPGLTGVIEWCDWDGNVKWSYTYGDAGKILHHDLHVLENGNVLVIGVEDISKEREIAMGRDPKRAQKNLWLDFVIEFKPKGKDGAEIVWEWHMIDHLIQEFDKTKSSFGVVADHPELLDINAVENLKVMSSATIKTLQGLGYIGTGGPAQPTNVLPDWTHMNSVTYNPKLDQVLVSVPNIGEIWIIDHSVNTKEAAGHTGGKCGKGGDLLYRWGNPQVYQRGLPKDQILFGQHDAMWVPEGLPGAGNITMFNNGEGRKGDNYSTIEEIKPPLKKDGTYELEEGQAYGPAKATWTYAAEKKTDFYSPYLSSAQRMPNGNTLICSGVQGRVFEVTADGDIVWEEDREVNFNGPGGRQPPGGGQGPGGPPGLGGGPGGPGGGPGGPGGGGRQRGRPGAGIAMSALSFAVGGSGQVAVFGTFEFFKSLSTLGGGQRGPGGPQGGPPGGGGPGGPGAFAGGPQGQGGPPGMPPGGPQGGPPGAGPGGPGGPQQGGPGMRQGGPGGPGGPQGGGPGQGQRQRPPGGQGGPGGQGPRMAGPGGPGNGPGGPGNGPGGGKASKAGGGLFRTIRYGLDYPAFVGRKLDPIPEDQLMSGGGPPQGGGQGGPPGMPQFGPGGPGGPGMMPPGGPGGPGGPPGNFDPSNPPPFPPPPGGNTEGMLPPPPNAPYPPDFRRPPNPPSNGSSGGAQPQPPPNGQPPYPPSAPGGNNGPQAK